MVKAPFNFVPLNGKVVYPYWADSVSHDIPFSDGLSGHLNLSIEAVSPVFVRNGQPQDAKEADTQQYSAFSRDNNKYFLPGTSIKGAVRSVLEIMSFCQLDDKVNNHQYSFRDLKDTQHYMPAFKPDKIKGGWLSYDKKNETYTLTSAGKPGRIKHEELEKKFTNYYSNNFGLNASLKDKQKTANFKYNSMLKGVTEYKIKVTKSSTNYGLDYYEISKDADLEGYLVLTGQPSPSGMYKKGGKNSEFIFFDTPNPNRWPLDADVIRNFKFAYFDHDTNKTSEDWKYWREKLENGNRIPVFFSLDDREKKVEHMGLSYLYKLPFTNSVQQSIEQYQKLERDKIDMSAVIFGHARKDRLPLKGRVTFSHAFSDNAQPMENKSEVLGSPKASYYPIYIRQTKKDQYSTFMDNAAIISGWKRYPVRMKDNIISNTPSTSNGPANDKISTRFTPVRQGAVFQGKLYYHNLRKIELGALLSALTFHNTPETYHSIGMAKPLGYGKVRVHIDGISQDLMHACLGAYEAYMEYELKGNGGWRNSPQLKELLSMTMEPTADDHLTYMKLKDHATAKNEYHFLGSYSSIKSSQQAKIPSFIQNSPISENTILQEKKRMEWGIKSVNQIYSDLRQEAEAELLKQKQILKQQWQQSIHKLEEELLATENLLNERRQELERLEMLLQKSIEALEYGPDWSTFKPGKDTFDTISKSTTRYLMQCYAITNDKHLPTEAPIFPESFRAKLVEVTEQLFREQVKSKKDQQKWIDKNSAQRKKFELWLGKQQADALFERLRNIADGK